MKKSNNIILFFLIFSLLIVTLTPSYHLLKMNSNQQHLQQWQPAQGFILFPDTNLMTATLKKVTDVGSIVGRAQFLEESLIIIEGVEKEQLEQGLAHNPLSLLPGRKGNCLIYGHREQFLWSLKDLKVGEPILIEGIFHYTVDEISIRIPNDF